MQEDDRADHIQLIISFILRGILTTALCYAVFTFNWTIAYSSALALFVSLLPLFIERKKVLYLPIEFELALTLLVFAGFFLGLGFGFYEIFWWWDLMLHSLSGVAIAFVGFLIVYLVSKEQNIKLTPIFVAIFSFCFSLALAVIWEIFEYIMDKSFGLIMQRSGIVDTMEDFIVATIGALIVATIGYFYVKGGDSLLFDRLTRKYAKVNERIFPNTLKFFRNKAKRVLKGRK